MKDPTYSMQSLCRCLSDPTRLAIVFLVKQHEELCVCDIQSLIDQSQPKVSRHLAELRTAGLLAADKRGKWVYYRLHPDLPEWTHQVLTLAETHDETINGRNDLPISVNKRC